jgi:hypothetical protein
MPVDDGVPFVQAGEDARLSTDTVLHRQALVLLTTGDEH